MEDIYKGHVPGAVVVIGGKVIPVQSYTCTQTNRGEAGVARLQIPLDVIDSSIFNDSDVLGAVQEVEIWAGYLEDGLDPEEQLRRIESEILGGQPLKPLATGQLGPQQLAGKQRYFNKRFSGYVSQPEWSIGMSGRYLSLSCIDWTGFLREFKFTQELTGSAANVTNIVAMMNKAITGLEIVLKPIGKQVLLGTKDGTSNKVVFDGEGKTYWDILQEISQKLSYEIIADHKTIHLTPKKDNPLLWSIYFGPKDNAKKNGVVLGQFAEQIDIRFGAKGRSDKANTVIEVFGVDKGKKGKDRAVHVIYGVTETKGSKKGKPKVLNPQSAPITTNTTHIKIYMPGDTNKQAAQARAENEYKKYAKRLITGTIQLPFANHFMSIQDIVTIVPDEDEPDLQQFKNVWFSVNSFSETFDISGFKQTIEFDSDPTLDNAPDGKIKPGKIKK